MTDNAITTDQSHLYLPAKDRSCWVSSDQTRPLQYLAWGARNFFEQPIPKSQHHGWVIALILEGRPILQTDYGEIHLYPGNIVTIAPTQASGWNSPENTECKFLLWVWQKSPNISSFHPSNIWKRKLSSQQKLHFQTLHDLCRKETTAIDSLSNQSLEGHFHILTAALHRVDTSPNKNTRDEERLHKATVWIQKNLDSPQPIARLCDFLNISQSSLHRLFTNHMSISPNSFLRNQKMLAAQAMLDKESSSLKEVAYQLGYRYPGDLRRALNAFHKTVL